MKALLICPADRAAVAGLNDAAPLVSLSLFSKPLLAYWLEHLASLGARQVTVLAADRPEEVRKLTGDGSRWGLEVDVIPATRELSIEEARAKYRDPEDSNWLKGPKDIHRVDHFPGVPEGNLFSNHWEFFNALRRFLPQAQCSPRIGLRQIRPGVWAGLHARISPDAKLVAPCWIGDYASVGANAIIGPETVVEPHSVIEAGAAVERSFVGPATLVGAMTEVRNSIVSGNCLINWRTGSSVKVPDPFLLCRLGARPRNPRRKNLLGRCIAMTLLVVSSPVMLVFAVWKKLQNEPAMRTFPAVFEENGWVKVVPYHEFCCGGWWRRWPRLWSIVQGDFAWVGNPPLPPPLAQERDTEFERLWFHRRPGLVSLLDAEGCWKLLSEEAKAHAAFYTIQANWRLDARILFRAFVRLCKRQLPALIAPEQSAASWDFSRTPVRFTE